MKACWRQLRDIGPMVIALRRRRGRFGRMATSGPLL